MPKEFYTEKDIEDLVKRGVLSLEVDDNSVLTDLAYERANRLGVKLIRVQADNPPGAPVRPYLSEKSTPRPATSAPSMAAPVAPPPQDDLSGRIRSAVIAKLGTQVDPVMLDTIIERVLKSTGLK
jgi:hypothetical protein